jgi:probable addiction module antidote protein
MPKEKIRYSDESKAKEAFAVLIRKERPSRSYSKQEMKEDLSDPQIYQDFLKLCIEHDASETLVQFRKGLLAVLKAMGMSWASEKIGLSRMTLYRMLSKAGNPELKNLVRVLNFIGMRPWVVSQDFVHRGEGFRRYKKELPDEVKVSSGKRSGRSLS